MAKKVMPELDHNLTMKQQAFVTAYLFNGFNATKAAKTAGYSEGCPSEIGYENLRKPQIVAEINSRLDSEGITTEKIKIALAQIAFGADPADFDQLATGKSLTTLRDEGVDTRMLKSITSRHEVGDDEVYLVTKFELHDRQGALDKLAKVHGMYHENLDVTSKGDAISNYPGLSPEELAVIAEMRGGPE